MARKRKIIFTDYTDLDARNEGAQPRRKTRSTRGNMWGGEDSKSAPISLERDNSSSSSTLDNKGLVDHNAVQFFKAQKKGAEGLRKDVNKAVEDGNSLVIKHEAYDVHYNSMAELDTAWHTYHTTISDDLAHDWLWLTTTNRNILMFGVGDKSHFLRKFARDHLQGEDVIEIFGNPHPKQNHTEYQINTNTAWVRSIRAVLDSIAERVLRLKASDGFAALSPIAYAKEIAGKRIFLHYSSVSVITCTARLPVRLDVHYGRVGTYAATRIATTSSSVIRSNELLSTGASVDTLQSSAGAREVRRRNLLLNKAVPKYGGRYAHTQARLYLLVHEICGPLFSHMEAQACLSIVAHCRSVSVVASAELLNVVQLWDHLSRGRFGWSWYHVPTYVHHRLPADHCILVREKESHGDARGAEGEADRLGLILATLPTAHKDLLHLVCKLSMDKKEQLAKKKGAAESRKSKLSIGATPAQDARCVKTDDVVKAATSAMILKTKTELYEVCKNFFDHRILADVRIATGAFLKVLLSDPYIADFAKRR
jgi:hypothetical protein